MALLSRPMARFRLSLVVASVVVVVASVVVVVASVVSSVVVVVVASVVSSVVVVVVASVVSSVVVVVGSSVVVVVGSSVVAEVSGSAVVSIGFSDVTVVIVSMGFPPKSFFKPEELSNAQSTPIAMKIIARNVISPARPGSFGDLAAFFFFFLGLSTVVTGEMVLLS